MAAPPDTGMDKAEMKRFLAMATKEPMNCAIGVAAEPGIGLLVLHKTKSPKALEKDLTARFPTAKAIRFGTVAIGEDDGVVKFTVNRAVSGLAPRLVKTLKGTGRNKVQIVLDDGTAVDGAADEADEEDAEDGATGQQAAGDEPTTEPNAPDLHQQLTDLINQISGTDPARLAALKTQAMAANAAIKAGGGDAAIQAIAALKDMLAAPNTPTTTATPTPTAQSTPSQPPPQPPPQPSVGTVGIVAMQKSRLVWDGTRKRVVSEIAALKAAASAAFKDDPEEAEVIKALDQLDTITATLDTRLLQALDDLLSEQDPAKHAALLVTAKAILADYATFVQTDPLVAKLNGDTPFGMKLTIGPVLAATVKGLQAALR